MNTKNVGIICEYDPFHKGHEYQICAAREAASDGMDAGDTVIVCIMSGHFTQRGMAAITDKWSRARMALSGGADLVIELPAVFACNGAGEFAGGAVRVLSSLGCIDAVSFGSTAENPAMLSDIGSVMAGDRYESELRGLISGGLTYPRAAEQAICSVLSREHADLMREPNNILAVQYIKHIERTCSGIKVLPVMRRGASHGATATAVRELLASGEKTDMISEHVTAETAQIIGEQEQHLFIDGSDSYRRFEDMIFSAILRADADELETAASAGEGLGRSLKKHIRYASDISDLIDRVRAGRYTRVRIARVLSQILTGITADRYREVYERPYARVLGMNDRGAGLLRRIRDEDLNAIPIITNLNRAADEVRALAEVDVVATDIYNLITGRDLYENCDLVRKPEIV